MKNKAPLLALILAAPLAGFASAGAGAFLLKANAITADGERSVATGGASLTSRDLRATADEIVYFLQSGILRLTGSVAIQTASAIIETKEATIDVEGKRVFLLSLGSISLATGVELPNPKATGEALRPFAASWPKTDTGLRGANR